jgi:starch synthase (maltosyl-transferring)
MQPISGARASMHAASMLVDAASAGNVSGASRVVVDAVTPQVDAGSAAVKSIVGEALRVEAQLFADGHDVIAGALRYRPAGPGTPWRELPMQHVADDTFAASFTPDQLGAWEYQVTGGIDQFGSWQHAFPRRSGEDAALNLRIGAELVQDAASRARGDDKAMLQSFAARLRGGGDDAMLAAASDDLARLMRATRDRSIDTGGPVLPLVVNRELARTGSWYEVFPRSLGKPGEHGTLRDVIDDLDRIKGMGFDVVYLPPIHPIGSTARKGANNAVVAMAGEPGVPYAIGAADGGHTALHAQLGTMDDFDALVAAARDRDMEIGMDLAFQASPDHPWIREHPGWFKWRPDGTIQHAENPPKQYQDVVPFDFESAEWPELWAGLTDSIEHWADRGVRAWRVDNPHTKPFGFWEYAIGRVKAKHPDTVFLSEAFARPNIQDRLGKVGFDQTYTYFPWKSTPDELRELGEHYAANGRLDYMTPSHWPTTHDILPENLQGAGRDAFALRATLASTMSPTWGNYGPAYEKMVNKALKPGSIEFLDSEKYQLVNWVRDGNDLSLVLGRLNQARHASPALQSAARPRFLDTGNDQLVAYLRSSPDKSDHVLVVANTDPSATRSGMVKLPLEELGIARDEPFEAVDLLDGQAYRWTGADQYVELGPGREFGPSHVLQLRRADG